MDGSAPFVDRHVGPRPHDVQRMLEVVGVASLEELIDRAVPDVVRDDAPLDLPPAIGEDEALEELRVLAATNRPRRAMIGQGYHPCVTPSVLRRNVLEDPSWYTAYTPYQAEISQGRLEALLNFQTAVADLSGLELANASLLDEATAAAEAMTMARRISDVDADVLLVDDQVHPQTLAVLRTRAEPVGIDVRVLPPAAFADHDAFGAIIQYPGTTGEVRDPAAAFAAVADRGGVPIAAADLLACTLLRPPGELGAQIVVGSTQRFGVPMFAGGPHAAYLATSSAHRRVLPGRLVGVSVDTRGRTGLRLALQTREQHIRRERATSNICTAQVLLAVIAGFYAVWHGPEGLTAIARRIHGHAGALATGLRRGGVELAHETWFDTLTAVVPGRAEQVVAAATEQGIDLRLVDPDRVGIACDETTDAAALTAVLHAFDVDANVADLLAEPAAGLPDALHRSSEFLTHPVFHAHRSETQMLRYLRRLSDRDLALDRTMIPLGSCTMKLNAAAEMEPVSWPAFADVHPYAPPQDTPGTRRIVDDLCAWLAEVTGYDAVSVQPNAGSQGELAGLLAIRAYHRARGEGQRDVCLVPESAHGTNAASAVMAGMRVVAVKCDDRGDIDLPDLERRTEQHAEHLAALMVTYPSTHGVYEEGIVTACDLVHDAGGQVYVDGANLNALVGIARPGRFGADVSHLNLHKTFCIPHGGGGPGVGPIGVRAHLAPYLPGDPLGEVAPGGVGAVAAARDGSAGILQIPWAYVRMMGPDGLRTATLHAVLAANYVAARLRDHFPVLYTGADGLVAHECVIDVRPFREQASAEDIAKRLIDHGFHAPTLSWPVAGTLMVEPTESEPLAELDRFCDAMIAVRGEIDRVASGEWPADDHPLRGAPHPAQDLLDEPWDHAYTREEAAYPGGVGAAKYWPPVSRIDAAYGDRNLMCACPPLSELAEE